MWVSDLHGGGDGGLAVLPLALMRLAGRATLNLTLILTAGRGPEKQKIAAQSFTLVRIPLCLARLKEQSHTSVSAAEELCCMGQAPEQGISDPMYSWRWDAETCRSHPSTEREKLHPCGP